VSKLLTAFAAAIEAIGIAVLGGILMGVTAFRVHSQRR
jgi:hypothetical protein